VRPRNPKPWKTDSGSLIEPSDVFVITNRLLTTKQSAKYLGLRPQTLRNMRSRGEGPKGFRFGRNGYRYWLSDLDLWIEQIRIQGEQSKGELFKGRRSERIGQASSPRQPDPAGSDRETR
jgi:predicted DNA-binding transcriptional regulator AlpA